MLSNIYIRKEEIVATSLSGGRPFYPYRLPVRATVTYKYAVAYGDNFHTLAANIFSDDADWWAIADLNKPKDSFKMKTGDLVILPESLVKVRNSVKKFF